MVLWRPALDTRVAFRFRYPVGRFSTSGWQAELGVQSAVVAAGQFMRRRDEHGATRVDEDVVDREQGRTAAWLWPPGGDQPVADLAGGVHVAEVQEPAELRVIKGGVVVTGEHHRRVTRRRQRSQFTAPPLGRRPGPGRKWRMGVDTDQLHGPPGGEVKPGGGLGGEAGPESHAVAQRVAGIDAAATVTVFPDVGHLVREQIGQPGPLEPGHGIVGEFLKKQHVSVGPANEPDDRVFRRSAD